jgi:hypothetical protein
VNVLVVNLNMVVTSGSLTWLFLSPGAPLIWPRSGQGTSPERCPGGRGLTSTGKTTAPPAPRVCKPLGNMVGFPYN